MRVCTVVGARPQFIKAAPVAQAFAAAGVEELLVHTGQHYDDAMSGVFFRDLGIPAPVRDLGVGSGPHGAQTGRMLAGLEEVFGDLAPDWVLVYGDTNSTLAGALAAAKLHIPVAHVEAGLRSFNRRMPEEVNRILTDHCADLLLPPTTAAAEQLRSEGIAADTITVVGDVMADAVRLFAERPAPDALADLALPTGDYVLLTLHRAENTDDPARLAAVVAACEQLASADGRTVVVPLHPRTRAAAEQHGLLARLEAATTCIPPQGFLGMMALERAAAVIATDSGGVQKEACFHGVPCVTLRDETEWTELVELGWNRLASPAAGAEAVAAAVVAAIGSRGRAPHPYGDGHAAERVVAAIQDRA